MLEGAEGAVARTSEVLEGAEGAVARTSGVLEGAERTVDGATRVLGQTDVLVGDANRLLGHAQRPLLELLPVLERLAETVSAREVDAAVLLVDRLPELLTAVEQDLLPLARQMRDVGPELHSLLGLVEDLHETVSKVPGMGLVRRRKDPEGD